ncbi:MAG: tRNA (adenosine(37)-N6)-threonylcarbamoyltransferase complex dimerization subunit type 1 TsaB [Actinomycetota bacterium]|nr:tRNA (adenosine(37)-N6)-threonylcarbamoyltransferase complex dimerization subunit type 1 TsaB [Actinomycetota bacterium]
MNVLGIDTSTPASAACVLRHDGAVFEQEPPPTALTAPPRHARELMPAIVKCLEESGLHFSELDAIAVGAGPGTFTGLRIGVTTARALAHAWSIELRPVSSLAALAAGVIEPGATSHEAWAGGGPVLALIDASRGEVFAALHEDGAQRWPPFAASPAAVAARVAGAGLKPLAVGNGSVRFRDVLEAVGIRVAPDGARAHAVRGLSICRLASDVAPTPPEAVLPDYLRAPDAKPR